MKRSIQSEFEQLQPEKAYIRRFEGGRLLVAVFRGEHAKRLVRLKGFEPSILSALRVGDHTAHAWHTSPHGVILATVSTDNTPLAICATPIDSVGPWMDEACKAVYLLATGAFNLIIEPIEGLGCN